MPLRDVCLSVVLRARRRNIRLLLLTALVGGLILSAQLLPMPMIPQPHSSAAGSLWFADPPSDGSSPAATHGAGEEKRGGTVSPADSPTRITSSAVDFDAPSSPKMAVAISSKGFANGAANRSPPRPPRHMKKDESLFSATLAAGESLRSWDVNGRPRSTPRWARPLLSAAVSEGVLGALLEAVRDEWMVLVGWVPTRFMGPQKVGKKADGSVMIPPTLGQNITVYHALYNASWHTGFVSEGMPYAFQLMHRNALAVCIRERLHIHALHVASDHMASAPLLVYHCPCRHCNEGSDAIAKVPAVGLETAFPQYETPLRRAGGMRAPVASTAAFTAAHLQRYPDSDTLRANPLALDQKECVAARAAPWLLPASQASSVSSTITITSSADSDSPPPFPYEGLHSDLDRLLQVQAGPGRVVLVAFFNVFWLDHLHNFVFSLVQRAAFPHFIIATGDPEALAACQAQRLPCFDARAFAEAEPEVEADGKGAAGKGFTRKVSEAMSWIKPRLAIAVLERGYHFIMSDIDLSVNYNHVRELFATGLDIAHQCDAKDKYSINSGFYLARSNPHVIRFLRNLMLFTPEENADQTAMKLFARYDHTHGISHGCLERKRFNMKCYYKKSNSVKVIDNKETFEWLSFDRNRKSFSWTLLHATCISGARAKILYLRAANAWFLDDLDAMTNPAPVAVAANNNNKKSAHSFCLSLMDKGEGLAASRDTSRRIWLPRRINATQHSRWYTLEKGEQFLAPRH